MDVFLAAVSLITEAMLVSARWAGRHRRLCLEQAAAVSDHSRLAELEARVLLLEDILALRDAHIRVLQQRLGKGRVRRPYPLAERLRILWLTEYFQIPRRRLKEMPEVSRSSVHPWLGAFRRGRTGKRRNARRATNGACRAPPGAASGTLDKCQGAQDSAYEDRVTAMGIAWQLGRR